MTSPTDIEPSDLPAAVRSYLAAHTARDAHTALQSFAADAVVLDAGQTFRGSDEILTFLQKAGAEFSYTTELIGAERWSTTRAGWCGTTSKVTSPAASSTSRTVSRSTATTSRSW